jgi:hypothetical protein
LVGRVAVAAHDADQAAALEVGAGDLVEVGDAVQAQLRHHLVAGDELAPHDLSIEHAVLRQRLGARLGEPATAGWR